MPHPRVKELWSLIIPFLRTPSPRPLSKPPRSALRQNALVALSRTCKLFNKLSKKSLYTDLITDDLPLLLDPSHITARLSSFALTKTLRIEYLDKGHNPKYEELCSNSTAERREAWGGCGPTAEEYMQTEEADARRETKRLTAFFDAATITLAKAFPHVENILIASIYGPDDVWHRIDTDSGGRTYERSLLQLCGAKFAHFIRSTSARQMCLRDLRGPLAQHNDEDTRGVGPFTTFHFTGCDSGVMFRYSSPSRWLYDDIVTYDWSLLLPVIGIRIRMLRQIRGIYLVTLPPPTLDLTITFSCDASTRASFDPGHLLFRHRPALPRHNNGSAFRLSPTVQSQRAAQLGKAVKAFVRQDPYGRGVTFYDDDKVQWESSVGASPCAACGSA